MLDPRGRSFWQEDVKLSEFGSFHSQVMLPETSPVGTYRVRVFDKESHSYEGAFKVRQYQLEPVHLSIETDRRVYYRGETIEGRIKAAFYYGAPLAGHKVRYQLADGAAITAKTDDQGEIHFKFPTREFRESQTLRLVAQLPERNLQTEQNFYLATQGFVFNLSTTRPVFVAGESFELTVKVRDAEGKPLPQKFALHVVEDRASTASSASGRSKSMNLRRTPKTASSDRLCIWTRGANTCCAPKASIGSTIRSRRFTLSRSLTTRTRFGCGFWPTNIPTNPATRPRCRSIGAKSQPWP